MSQIQTRDDVTSGSVWNSRIYGHKRQVKVSRRHGMRVVGVINGKKLHHWGVEQFLKSYFKFSD